MSLLTLTKDFMEESFIQYLGDVFKHPEIESVCVKKNLITRDTVNENGRKAFEAGFHDVYSDADLVIGGFNHLYYSRNIEKLPKNEDLRELYFDGFLNMPWNKLYKKRLIRELFPMDIDLGEDLVFNQSYLRGCKDFKIVQASVYDYIQDDRGFS